MKLPSHLFLGVKLVVADDAKPLVNACLLLLDALSGADQAEIEGRLGRATGFGGLGSSIIAEK